jgi:hypothetical protein
MKHITAPCLHHPGSAILSDGACSSCMAERALLLANEDMDRISQAVDSVIRNYYKIPYKANAHTRQIVKACQELIDAAGTLKYREASHAIDIERFETAYQTAKNLFKTMGIDNRRMGEVDRVSPELDAAITQIYKTENHK